MEEVNEVVRMGTTWSGLAEDETPRQAEESETPQVCRVQIPAGLEGSVIASVDFILRRTGATERFSNHPDFRETTLGEQAHQPVLSKEAEPVCVCVCVCVCVYGSGAFVSKSCLTLVTLWTVARQALLSMGFSRQEYWSGLPFPPPGDLPDPRMESTSPALQQGSLHKYNIHTYIYLSDAQILIICANYII